jgi:hypothetical protein
LVNLVAIINFNGLYGIIRWYAGHLSGWWRCFSQWGVDSPAVYLHTWGCFLP